MERQYTPQHFDAHYEAFLSDFPAYKQTLALDDLRQTDYARLDRNQQVYLDYTGGGLYAKSQLEQHFQMLEDGVWGNPHSQNPTSLAMTQRVEQARAYVLSFFRADPDEYDIIFTPNASGALKIVGESFPFKAGGRYLVLTDNHNSVNGIREFARSRGASVDYVWTTPTELRIDDEALLEQLNTIDTTHANLFAYPAQSNYSGVKHDLTWIDRARERGWTVLLDAAAFAPTNRLDLSQVKPDFVTMSFYKIFGYPTGIGCLIARKEAIKQLQRPWFAGGTITIASVQSDNWHYLIDGHAAFEDGTVNYLSIPAVEIGLKHIESIGIERIQQRVACLTGWLLQQLTALRHDNGKTMVCIHGPQNINQRGGTIAFTLSDPSGHRYNYRRIEQLANQAHISLRTGCFCNPGSGELSHELKRDEMEAIFHTGKNLSFDELYETVSDHYHKHPSTIRVSLGLVSNFHDAYALMTFLEALKNQTAHSLNAMPMPAKTVPDTA